MGGPMKKKIRNHPWVKDGYEVTLQTIDMTDRWNQAYLRLHPNHVIVLFPTIGVTGWVDKEDLYD
jgi:hypothetical protein